MHTTCSSAIRDAARNAILESLRHGNSPLLGAKNSRTPRVARQAFTVALNNEAFVRDLMSCIVGAMVQVLREEELIQSVHDVVA